MIAKQGHFIVVEGLEGAGKSTALLTIKRFLKEFVPELIVTREPGGTHVGEVVRTLVKEVLPSEALDPRAELLLFYAARVQLLQEVIRPALARGAWVLADRFELSTFAYQGGGRGLDSGMLEHLSAFCLDDFKPDLLLFLDITPERGLQRARRRGKIDRIEQESLAFFTKVAQAYQQKLKTMNHAVIIDANQSLPVVQEEICHTLKNYLAQYVSD